MEVFSLTWLLHQAFIEGDRAGGAVVTSNLLELIEILQERDDSGLR